VPVGIGIDVEVPPDDSGGGGDSGEIIDARFDGAFLGGMAAGNGTWRIDANFIWAAIGGDRVDRPALRVDVDAIYGHAKIGRAIAPEWYVTAGVRRAALKYDIDIGSRVNFERKPGVWDPMIGVGWHRAGEKMDWHVSFEGGGFGAGTDVDVLGDVHFDWKPTAHFGLMAGYTFTYFRLTDDVRDRVFTVKQLMHGPTIGIGFYF
jgi:hypothetical protein